MIGEGMTGASHDPRFFAKQKMAAGWSGVKLFSETYFSK
jgi:hypothetical protein